MLSRYSLMARLSPCHTGSVMQSALRSHSLKAAVCKKNIGFIEHRHDLLQIFFGDILTAGNVLQRDVAVILVLCEIQQHAQRIAPFGGNFHAVSILYVK